MFILPNLYNSTRKSFVEKMASYNSTVAPENTQNYNKYTYVLNNPLKYIDPSGYMSQHYVVQTNMYAEMSRIALQLSAERQEAWGDMKAQIGSGSLLGNMYLGLAIFGSLHSGGGGSGDAPDGGDGGGDQASGQTNSMEGFSLTGYYNIRSILAVVAGEASNNFEEGQWMTCVIINRLIDEGVSINALDLWSQITIGDPHGDFKALDGNEYDIALQYLLTGESETGQEKRLAGAWSILSDYLTGNYVDLTGGSAFFNQSPTMGPKYIQTGQVGVHYFYKLSNGNVWP